ncbi:MAG: hypothetical protein PHQ78_01000 [Candidatus Cloacimonetes bacterium]|nr:hypothetical protein [Candidatus Cloacimonadota bacterium]MDD4560758.1 hypothetical protein [Candidatus Cloacimonadota bacterium]
MLVFFLIPMIVIVALFIGCSGKATSNATQIKSADLEQICCDHDMILSYLKENMVFSGTEGDSLVFYEELSQAIDMASEKFSAYFNIDADVLYANCMLAYEPFRILDSNVDYVPANFVKYDLSKSNLSSKDQQLISAITEMYEKGEQSEDIYEMLNTYKEYPDLSQPMKGFVAILLHEWSPDMKGPFLTGFCDALGYAIGAGACPNPIGAFVIGPVVAGSASLIAHHF